MKTEPQGLPLRHADSPRGDNSGDMPLLPVPALPATPSGGSSASSSTTSCRQEATPAYSVSDPVEGKRADTTANGVLPSSRKSEELGRVSDSSREFCDVAGVSGIARDLESASTTPGSCCENVNSATHNISANSDVVFNQSGVEKDSNTLTHCDSADSGFVRAVEEETDSKYKTKMMKFPENCCSSDHAPTTNWLHDKQEMTLPPDEDKVGNTLFVESPSPVNCSATSNAESNFNVTDTDASAFTSPADDSEESKQPLLATNTLSSKLSNMSNNELSATRTTPTNEKGMLASIKEECEKGEGKRSSQDKVTLVKEDNVGEENSERDHGQNQNRSQEDTDNVTNTREENDSTENLALDPGEDLDDEKDFEDRHTDDGEHHDDEEDDVGVDEEEEDKKFTYHKGNDIDRGFAWVVLAAAFTGMTLFGTFTFSTGIFQAEILQVLEPDVRKTAWVGAVHYSTLCLMGPFAGLIKHKLGSRLTVVLSSVVICLGMVGASFSTNVTQLIITYGIITGMGTGTALNPMFVCVSYYFERYRGLTSGIIAAGAGAGMFIGGPAIRFMIDTYGLSGAYLIWGAVGLNIGVMGMFMRPSSLERAKEHAEREMIYYDQSFGPPDGVDPFLVASLSTLPSAGGYWGSVLGASSILVKMDTVEAEGATLQQSQMLLEVPDIHNAIRSNTELSVVNSPELLEAIGRPIWRPPQRNFRSSQYSMGDGNSSCNEFTLQEVVETSARTDWRPRNPLSSQLSMGESLDSYSTERSRLNPLSARARAGLGLLKAKSRETARKGSLMQPRSRFSLCQALTSALDSFRFVRNPGFALYLFSGSIWVLGESIVFLYLPTYAETKGSTAFQSATLITALGSTNTLSRLVSGFVAGDASVGPDVLHVGLLGLCGLFTATFPLYANTYGGQVAFSLLYGIYSGGLASVINLLIISFIGVEFVSLAFGIICFGQGLASLLGAPMAAAIAGTGIEKNYDDVFVFAGILLLAAGCLGFPMVIFKSRAQEVDTDVEKVGGETTRAVPVRMKGESCHT